MVVGVADENQIDGIGSKMSRPLPAQNTLDIGDAFFSRSFFDVIDRLLSNIHRINLAIGSNLAGHETRHEAAPCPDVGDIIADFQPECRYDGVTVLVGGPALPLETLHDRFDVGILEPLVDRRIDDAIFLI